jgi:hypothetical protein
VAYNISEFKSNIGRYGIQPTNKFMTIMTAPLSINLSSFTVIADTFNTLSAERMIYLRSEQVKIPGVTIAGSDNKRYGVGVAQKMPHNVQFSDISMTFVADQEGIIYRYFYSWINQIVDFNGSVNYAGRSSYMVGYKDNYVTDIYIFVYDNYGNISKTITLYDAFPISMNEISLDWNQTNTVMKINVNFSYKEWSIDNVSTAFGSTLDLILGAFGGNLGDFTNGISFNSFNTGPSLFSSSFGSGSPQTSTENPTATADTTTGSPSNLGGI